MSRSRSETDGASELEWGRQLAGWELVRNEFRAPASGSLLAEIASLAILSFMPLYEFHCAQCGKDNELLVRTSDWSQEKCPSCGSKQIEKKLSVFAAQGAGEESAPECSGNPSACGRCQLPGM